MKILESIRSLNQETRFVILYIVTLLIAFSPSKALGQFIGVICILGLIFFVRLRPTTHIFKYFLIVLIYTFFGGIYYFLMPDFSFVNYYLFFATASSFLILFYNLGPIVSPSLIEKLSKSTLAILFFEAIYGLVQGVVSGIRSGTFDIGSGDNVRGTIEPSLTSAGLGGNVMFAILISSLLIFTLGTSRLRFSPFRILAYIACALVWVIASVLHSILFFGVAAILTLILIKMPRRKHKISRRIRRFRTSMLAVMLLVAMLLPIFLPGNLASAPNFLAFSLDIRRDAESEKSRATYFLLFHLSEEYPYQPIIGLGPGQYSSRASLIRSGEYLRGSSLPLPNYSTAATQKHILPLWWNVLNRPGQGSSYFPFSSWLSLYGEIGLLGIILLGLLIFKPILNLRRWHSQEFPGMNIALLTMLLYILLLGFQDNYWEFTQAVFPAFFTLTIGYHYLKSEKRVQRVVEQESSIHHKAGSAPFDVVPQTR